MSLHRFPTLLKILLIASETTSQRALAKATLPEDSEILQFYYMADREGFLEEQTEEGERQYRIDISDTAEKNELAKELIDEGYNGWDDKSFRAAPISEKEEALKNFYVNNWIRQQEEEANSTEVFFEKAKIISSPTLVRYTDHITPEQAMAPGFKFPGHEPENMGLTAGGGWSDRHPDEDGNLAFAFDVKDLKSPKDWAHGKHYGKYAYQFKVPYAVKVWHISDYEWQVVFDVNTIKDIEVVDLEAKTKTKKPLPRAMKKGEKIPF